MGKLFKHFLELDDLISNTKMLESKGLFHPNTLKKKKSHLINSHIPFYHCSTFVPPSAQWLVTDTIFSVFLNEVFEETSVPKNFPREF